MDLWTLADLCTPWCIHVAVSLRVANRISAAPDERLSVADLASACGVDKDALHRVLRHLASKGVFLEHAGGVFGLDRLGHELASDAAIAGFDLNLIGGRMARAWATLPDAVRTGRSAYAQTSGGLDFWQDLEAHPEVSESFDALMGVAGHGRPNPDFLLDPASWQQVRTVVDVGGGSGSLLAEVLAAYPLAHGILVDRPATVARCGPVFAAAGVAMDRVTVSPGSFFEPLPAGGDLYLLKSVLGDWADEEAEVILRRCAEAARPGNGRVVLLNGVTPDDEPSHPDLLMLVLVSGKTRSLQEFKDLARKAGLGVITAGRNPRSGGFIVEAVPLLDAVA